MKKYESVFIEIKEMELVDVLLASGSDAGENFGDLNDWVN